MEVSCLSSGAGQKRGCPARPRAWTGRTTPPGHSMGCMASDGPPPAPITASPRPPGPVPSGPPSRHLAGAADPDRATCGGKPEIGLLGLRRGTAPTTGQTGGRGRCPRNLHVVGPASGPPPRTSATGKPRGRPPKPPDPGPKQKMELLEEDPEVCPGPHTHTLSVDGGAG